MSDMIYIGRRMRTFDSSPQFDGYTKVVIVVSEDVEYTAGVDTGRTLTMTNPWGTQEMANNILASIRGYQYQPYTAEDAILDPAAELGDGVTANNVYGGIYTMETRFGNLCKATVSAPSEEEIDHEYPYVPKQERQVNRTLYGLTSELKVQAGLISAEVSERKSDVSILNSKLTVQANQIAAEVSERKSETSSLKSSITQESSRITAEIQTRSSETASLRSTLDIQSGQISAKVSKTGGSYSSFGWTLADNYWELYSGSNTVLRATASGLEVRGKITALSGSIGGFDIMSNYLSYNGQTWGGTNTYGAYLGINGLQLGKNFRVDMAGNLYASSGHFDGTVRAGSIAYDDGEYYGRLSGSALAYNSLSGSRLHYNTITTDYTSGGINTSLGYADYANGVFNGWNRPAQIACNQISTSQILMGGRNFGASQISYVDPNGKSHTINVVTWSWR